MSAETLRIPDVSRSVHYKCHAITVKPKVNFESLLLQIDRNQVIALCYYIYNSPCVCDY